MTIEMLEGAVVVGIISMFCLLIGHLNEIERK